ncbi:MBL fold metallo-hydrolase RNA specificity domain-containing protein [Mycoplasmopsis agalactiae]|uniref:MBL fold metallo-hydrolase RNA specificity domain-containing protein n=1 Tax=Mycoplasmopsis agalactiae TaxID=2110 RepID=UPI00280AD6DB|nr:MBL fold metallo-hydrolase RNA specificity domain-containing protein [Mycoplasmopsis agalactiae]
MILLESVLRLWSLIIWFFHHHPAREDLAKLINILKPEYVIPVQGLYRYLQDAQRYIVKM